MIGQTLKKWCFNANWPHKIVILILSEDLIHRHFMVTDAGIKVASGMAFFSAY